MIIGKIIHWSIGKTELLNGSLYFADVKENNLRYLNTFSGSKG